MFSAEQGGSFLDVQPVQRQFRDGGADYWAEQVVQVRSVGAAYDTFMWDYVGDPWPDSHDPLPEIARNGTVYDRRLVAGFTEEGTLLDVRERSVGTDGQTTDFFVAAVNVKTGTIRELNIVALEGLRNDSNWRDFTLVLDAGTTNHLRIVPNGTDDMTRIQLSGVPKEGRVAYSTLSPHSLHRYEIHPISELAKAVEEGRLRRLGQVPVRAGA